MKTTRPHKFHRLLPVLIRRHAVLLALACTVLCLVLPKRASAQNEQDTIAHVSAVLVAQPKPNAVDLDVWVLNISDNEWLMWANGTFQLEFPGIAMEECSVELLPGFSDLPAAQYEIIHNTFPGRMSIGVLGPRNFGDCIPVAVDDSIRVGRFRVSIPEPGFLPLSMDWVQPLTKFQATAFKIFDDRAPFFFSDDNVAMLVGDYATSYEVRDIDLPPFLLVDFYGEYLGDRKVRLFWRTESEYANRGFVIVRGIRPIGQLGDELDFVDTIACHELYPAEDPDCRRADLNSPGLSLTPLDYSTRDTVEFREEEYVYRLYYHHFDGSLVYLAETRVYVPSSVISSAQANPNPFSRQTTIQYAVDDRVILTAKVYDYNGREVETLIDRQITPIGRYEIRFEAARLSSQGLYNVRFTAYPVDDPAVLISTADVKLQLIR